MPKVRKEIERGEVFWARLDPTVGSELQKTRPVVVLSIKPTASELMSKFPDLCENLQSKFGLK